MESSRTRLLLGGLFVLTLAVLSCNAWSTIAPMPGILAIPPIPSIPAIPPIPPLPPMAELAPDIPRLHALPASDGGSWLPLILFLLVIAAIYIWQPKQAGQSRSDE